MPHVGNNAPGLRVEKADLLRVALELADLHLPAVFQRYFSQRPMLGVGHANGALRRGTKPIDRVFAIVEKQREY